RDGAGSCWRIRHGPIQELHYNASQKQAAVNRSASAGNVAGNRPTSRMPFQETSMDEAETGRAYNAVSDFIDANVERGFGDKIAFTDPQRMLSYGELQAATWRFGRCLST